MLIELNQHSLKAAYGDLIRSYSIEPQENTYGAISLIVMDLRKYDIDLPMPTVAHKESEAPTAAPSLRSNRQQAVIEALVADLEFVYGAAARGEIPEISIGAFKRLRDAHEILTEGDTHA